MAEERQPGLATLVRGETAPAHGSEDRSLEPPLPVRAVLLQAAGLWVVTRVALIVFTYFAVIFNGERHVLPVNRHSFDTGQMLAHWYQWDSVWYGSIAVHGYASVNQTSFFPLYPVMIRAVIAVIGSSHVMGVAIILANLATLSAFIAIGLLAATLFGASSASYAVRAFAAFPTAFFLASGYADGLFIALAAFSLLAALRGYWCWSAAFAFLAALTRPFGIVLILPLLIAYLRSERLPGRSIRELHWRPVLRDLLPLVTSVPVALALWSAYVWNRFGDPLAFAHVQAHSWHRLTVTPWRWVDLAIKGLQHAPAGSFPQAKILFDLAPALALGVLTPLIVRRLPLSLVLYLLGVLLLIITSAVPLDYDPIHDAGRHALMALPVFLVLGYWMIRRPWLDLLVVAGGFLLQGLFAAFFLRGGWLV